MSRTILGSYSIRPTGDVTPRYAVEAANSRLSTIPQSSGNRRPDLAVNRPGGGQLT